MSEAEKQRRQDYRIKRQKWIMIMAIIMAAAILFTFISAILYYTFNKAYYIEYVENSKIDYQVLLKENEFYENAYDKADKAYVAALIDKVIVDFGYDIQMNAEDVLFEYSFSVDAVLQVKDNNGGLLYERTDILKPEKRISKTGNSVIIGGSSSHVEVDYASYDELAKKFIEFYELDGTTSNLLLRMHVNVIGDCEEFDDETNNEYVVSLNVPLNVKTVNMSESSSVEEGDNVILACENATLKNVFMILTIVLSVLTVLYAIAFLVFIYLTRNTDINYDIKVNRILKNYRSFIQKITNGFDQSGYQILILSDFNEMLEIRDTIHAPILMDENEDHTCTQFLIPTNTKILYVFEIKVDDYDEIYAPKEEVVILEDVGDDKIDEALNSEDVSLDEIDYIDDEDIKDESEGVEIISVVWPEKEKKNKLYRYDPNGEQVHDGDIVLVPSRDNAQNKDVIRKAAVAHGNHRVDPATLHHPLKKIIAIVKRKAEDVLSSESDKNN